MQRIGRHPKLQRLLEMHHAVLERESHPAMHLRADLRSFDFDTLVPFRFDTILIDAPLAEYGQADNWSWDELAALPIPRLAAQPSFIWIWVGSGSGPSQGLERGRDLLARWGYRRCEDIVWLKSNTRAPAIEDEPVTDTLLTHTKEHCLMGIKGTVRRSTDGAFARCNIDTDVIVWEGDPDNPLAKPPELHALIENFCLGSRRLELFGSRARRGWLTLGPADIDSAEQFEQAKYAEWFAQNGALFTTTQEIDDLRPKSPPPRTARGGNPTGGIGRGRGRRESPAPPPVPAQQMQMNAQAQAFIPMPFNPMLAFYGMPQYQS
ncbi:uncharacterized protein L969DRAFT_141549 [Mixia osmundae IAM 14324]|uniref:uncharacterized protein n=1 Tax=Mixia osmundae (strain CBS 9802 / IAM 14324 / JCM 22182 / KY 12970) TaxID=764103 RepID=UPI0004A54F63|nr:uncharacterized protein L969DRAFT_141549 [Mixia osmundae IAM 14324]KEI42301.1 hypothetical protein L969DRAFT_141549 [Mixia osmundae IAM 14324]